MIFAFSRFNLETDDIGKEFQDFIELEVIGIDLDFQVKNPRVNDLDYF